AGTGQKAHGSFTLGDPRQVPLRSPWALLAYGDVVFIAMAGSHQIWVLIEEQRIGPFAGTGQEALVDGPVDQASFNQPSDLAFSEGYLFIADAEASAIRAIGMSEPLEVITLAGQGLFEYGDVDGVGAQIRLQHAAGLATADGVVYIADTYNNKIKTLDPYRSVIETLIGDNPPGLANGPFEQARLYEPEGLAILGRRLYIADTNNHRICAADLETRQVSTFALRENGAPAGPQEAAPLRLVPVEVRAGPVEIRFDLQLPEGYKLNSEIASQVYLVEEGPAQAGASSAGHRIGLRLVAETDTELSLDLYVYYCQAGDASLCYVHNRELRLPLRVVPDGQAEVTIPYSIAPA
ncbi:MAG TPA: hypothetical protein VHO48_11445, partial [Anaerolineaceae bacterium]|nr:hypothetical protein [Anaerolineaceae bacterium]